MIDMIISAILRFKQVLQSVSIGSVLGVPALVAVNLFDVVICLFVLSFLVFIFSGLGDDDD